MSAIDIAVEKNDYGFFDISIDPDTGDFKLVDGFDTALAMSIFCERRADESEVPAAELRRGWWGNEINVDGFEIGSKLWLTFQSRRNQKTLNDAVDFARDGLSWLTSDGYLKSIDVSASFTTSGGSLSIKLNRSNSPTESRSFDLWENTNGI